MVDLYKILGVSKFASKEEIKKRYYQLAKKMHPDSGESKDDTEFKQIALAYSILSDDAKRERYDKGESVDDIGADNRQAKLVTVLAEIVVKVIKGHDAKYTDLVAVMRHEVKAALTEVEALLEQAKDAVQKCEEAMSRLEGETELVHMVLANTLNGIRRQQEKVEDDLSVFKEVYDKLNKLKYKFDERPKGEPEVSDKRKYRTMMDEFNDIFGGKR